MNPKHAIILVAGEGKRLLPFTETNPKCFAEVGGTRILENALQCFAANGCERIKIVTGHFSQLIQDTITATFEGMAISYQVNEIYQTTNSMYSLHLGLEGLGEPTWVLEGDVFFESSILSLPVQYDIAWFVDSRVRSLDGAFVETDVRRRAQSLQIIRDLSLLEPNQHKSIGILRYSANGVRHLRQWLSEAVEQEKTNLYYDLILAEHMQELFVEVVDVDGRKWFEIDSPDELEEARRVFA